jgi:hypothetical protein
VTVANSVAYCQHIPLVGTSGEDWMESGVSQLERAKPGVYVLPEYGALPHITTARK